MLVICTLNFISTQFIPTSFTIHHPPLKNQIYSLNRFPKNDPLNELPDFRSRRSLIVSFRCSRLCPIWRIFRFSSLISLLWQYSWLVLMPSDFRNFLIVVFFCFQVWGLLLGLLLPLTLCLRCPCLPRSPRFLPPRRRFGRQCFYLFFDSDKGFPFPLTFSSFSKR